MKTLVRLILRLCFGYRAFNTSVLTTRGPVLLVPNHVSWLDWLFLGAVLDDDWKFVTSSTTANTSWLHRKMMMGKRTFPVKHELGLRGARHGRVPGTRWPLGVVRRRSDFGHRQLDEVVRRHWFSDPQNQREGHHVLSP